jgi:predicted enzyme related to lactoylglutathione lyase
VLAKVTAQGGKVIAKRHPDEPGGNFYIATFHDPAGNLIGL